MIRSVKKTDRAPYTPQIQTPQSTPGLEVHRMIPGESDLSKNAFRSARGTKTRSDVRTSQSGGLGEFQKQATRSQSNRNSRLQALQTSTPITPSLDRDNSHDGHARVQRQPGQSHPNQYSVITPEMETTEFNHVLSPKPERSCVQGSAFTEAIVADASSVKSSASQAEDQFYLGPSISQPRPSVLDTSTAQDASLPSPSLSPVTAAANLQNRRSYFDEANVQSHQMAQGSFGEPGMTNRLMNAGNHGPHQNESFALSGGPPSLMDIPLLLDSFEAMPTEMKRYVMYQLLRRSPKQVLHFVAENVNPALKCDFLSLLPPELSQNVIRHLDLRSLCRASQVSKKWREVIDTDEKIWKDLFDAEGFDLPAAELQRAISEGWGWQHGSDPEDYERDVSSTSMRSSSTGLLPSVAVGIVRNSVTPTIDANTLPEQQRRPKRKAAQRGRVSSRKQPKRDQLSLNEIAVFDTEAFQRHLEEADGPYAAAQAALLAVPNPKVGLPSLTNLHLHKSIYRRHHLISSNWMQDEIKPRHLAFKAHQRHVVTCLQFDAEKIVTGSDDTNINVYDTRTGALRARLEGHEGGVWALQYEGTTLVSGSTDRSVRVWDIDKGVCTHVFLGHTSTVRCLIILMPTEIGKTPSGRSIVMPKEPIIVTGSRDSTLRVWKLPKPNDTPYTQSTPPQEGIESQYFIRALTGHGHSVRAIAAHGDTLISGSYDNMVRVWKISTGETIHRLQGHTSKVYSVVLDHERNRCISGSMDNYVKIWSLETGSLLHTLEGHTSLVGLLDLQRNRLVSAAADSTLRIWDSELGQCRNVLGAHTGAITCFQHDGRKVISGADRNLKMWNVQTGEFIRDLLTDLTGVWQVRFDERRCVAAVQRGGLTYIEVTIPPCALYKTC